MGPSEAAEFGWGLQSFVLPGLMALESHILLEKLTWQVQVLSKATEKGLQLINRQVQANPKMTLQSRLALDVLWLKEHGLCGFLKSDKELCCIHIPNVTGDLQEQLEKGREGAKESRAIRDTAEQNWFNKTLQGIGGWSLKGWLASLCKGIILLITLGIPIAISLGCIKRAIEKSIWK